MIMEMIYVRENGTMVMYALKTNPPEAAFYSTTKLKKTEIKILSKVPAGERVKIREEKFNDIVNTEGNPPSKTDSIPKKHKGPHGAAIVKVGEKQQKTRYKNK